MNIPKLLKPFRRKMLWESAIKAAILALALGALGIFATALAYRILIRQDSFVMLAMVGGGIFAIAFLLFFFLGWPTEKKVAARMDALGLQERVSTMVEFRDCDATLVQLQRQDAAAHIGKTSPRQLRIHIGKGRVVLCAVSVCLAALMLAIPYNIIDLLKPPPSPEEIRQQMLREMIQELREDASAEEFDDSLQDTLQEILDELEADLQNAQNDIERAAEIQEAIEQLQQQAAKITTRHKIGKALQKFDLTRDLGKGIHDNRHKDISAALDVLENALLADTALVMQLNQTMVSALVDSEVDENDLLYRAVAKLMYPLLLLDLDADSYPEDLHALFEEAETAIIDALKHQTAAEQQISEMQNTLRDAMDRMLGNERRDPNKENGEDQKEQPDGEKPSDEKTQNNTPESSGPQGPQQPPSGSSGKQQQIMTEGIYDPVIGKATYGEVFASYYAQYLQDLENQKIPEDLQPILDRYFAELD